MMRSMFSAVSGMRAHQTSMDVIGNNIANVNTVGYKSSRTTFAEIFSQTIAGAGAPDPNSGRGGTNPMQIGLGMGVSAIDTMTTRGSVQRTDSPTDLAIDGEGFFIVRSGDTGVFQFTRAGNFVMDKLGNLVTSGGLNVHGWMGYTQDADGNYVFDTESPIKPINFYEDDVNLNKRIIAAKATTRAVMAGNLDATEVAIGGYTGGEIAGGGGGAVPADDLPNGLLGTTTFPSDGGTPTAKAIDPHFIVPIVVYDSLGNEYKINLNLWKNFTETTGTLPNTTSSTTWYWNLADSTGSVSMGASGFIKFDANGKIVTNDNDFPAIKEDISFEPSLNVGTDPFDVDLDFTKITMYSSDSSVKPSNVDGYKTGNLVTFSIGSDGMITGVYSNGRQQPLGMVALATFENPAGMQRVGSNLFIPTTNSGDFTRPIKPGSEDAGALSPGTLEMSNVDLAKQFTEMIITQRGFQANSRVMTTSDEILQELTNLKR